jgi:Protein involved in catabolism of external DNA
VIALWYPILTNGAQNAMVAALRKAHADAMVHEVRFRPARPGHGMVGSGMVILNAPWGTDEAVGELDRFFAKLAR